MFTITDLIKICQTYNITSSEFGPTIYKKGKTLGLCLDIKDSSFGYLTRAFIFDTIDEIEYLLKQYLWYQKNKEKYNIELKLDSYETPNPKIIYLFHSQELTLDEMLNIDKLLIAKEEQEIKEQEKETYLTNIQELTNYLINILQQKINASIEKEELKLTENDLKYELLKQLTTYYGSEKEPLKKEITKNPINTILNTQEYLQKSEALKTAEFDAIITYLNTLIENIKNEELDEKYYINLYSNDIYKYNISILKKQIDFVKNKIQAEKNFSLKGSKIHNIDEELKTFLNNSPNTTSIEEYLQENLNKVKAKYGNINLKNAYFSISGNELIMPKQEPKINQNQKSCLDYILEDYNKLDEYSKGCITLYNSFYKDICNYIWTNNYPNSEEILTNFDFSYYYDELKEIAKNVNNNHYNLHYFSILDFKSLQSYLASIINLCKKLENIKFNLSDHLFVFSLNTTNYFKVFSLSPNFNQSETTYFIDLPKSTQILFAPTKLIIDEETKEINTLTTNTIYYKGNIIESCETITLNQYKTQKEPIKKYKITVTKKLEITNTYQFEIGYIEGETL